MIDRILVPLDESKLAEEALSYTGILAQKFEAEIILVRVAQPMPVLSTYIDAVYYESDCGWMPDV